MRATENFAASAAAAQEAYSAQREEAADAVAAFQDKHDMKPGQKLTWRRRPDVIKV